MDTNSKLDMSTNPEQDLATLQGVGRRYQKYTDSLNLRPENEDIAEGIRAGLRLQMKIKDIAEMLGMHRVQMDRDFGWVWKGDRES